MEEINVKELALAGLQAFEDEYCQKCETCCCANKCKLYRMLSGELNFFGMEMLIREDDIID